MNDQHSNQAFSTLARSGFPTIGILGYGNIGRALGQRLADSGRKVIVHDRNLARIQRELPDNITVSYHIAGLAECDVVFTCLPDDVAVDSVTTGPGGLFGVLRKGAVHISTSTVSPTLSRQLAAGHLRAGQTFLVAAILGNPDIVRTGQAFLLTGGREDVQQALTPLLQQVAQRIFHVADDSGMASLMKLACNTLTGVTLQSMGEMIALLSKAGIDRQQVFDILTNSMFDGRVHRFYGGKIVNDGHLAPGMAATLALKDFALAMAEAEQRQVPMPLAGMVHARLMKLQADGLGALDWSVLGAVAAQDAGLEVKLPARQRS